MSIRIKLALVLMTGIAAATLAAAAVFVQMQRNTLRAAEEEKTQRILEDVARIGREAQLARDPLMFLDYLSSLVRTRPEVGRCRVYLSGRWDDVKGSREAEADMRPQTVGIASPDGDPGREMRAEVWFSTDVLALRERRAFESMLSDLSRAVGVVMLAAFLMCLVLGWTLSRRIVRVEAALAEIGQGRLGTKVRVSGNDEIARLSRGLNAMSDRLQDLEKMKKTFVASVTHELRSPLGAIESYVKGLLAEPARWPEDDRRNLERIRSNAARLGHFVTNLLEMSKIERGRLDFFPRPADLGKLAEDTVLFFSAKAQEARVQLDVELEKDLPSLRMDPDLIAQVVTNLVTNAIKFTRPGGRVRVAVRRVSKNGHGALECAVEDTGVGIPQEALGRIFAPFERVRNPLHATGAGLGLAISKSILEMHAGTIGVASEPGKGSRFHFILPLNSAPQPARLPPGGG